MFSVERYLIVTAKLVELNVFNEKRLYPQPWISHAM